MISKFGGETSLAPKIKGVETRPEGANDAFLLVHGFCAAPNELQTLGRFLEERSIASFAVQLAGHGTTPAGIPYTPSSTKLPLTTTIARFCRSKARSSPGG